MLKAIKLFLVKLFGHRITVSDTLVFEGIQTKYSKPFRLYKFRGHYYSFNGSGNRLLTERELKLRRRIKI